MESKESKDTTIHLQLTFLEFKSPAILNLTAHFNGDWQMSLDLPREDFLI